MDKGIDISVIAWTLFVVVGVIVKLVSAAKSKVEVQNPESFDSPNEGRGESRAKSVEEILQDLFSDKRVAQVKEIKNEEALDFKESQEYEVSKPVKTQTFQGDLLGAEIAGEEEDLSAKKEVDFDLRHAVIMSEILSRKYDE